MKELTVRETIRQAMRDCLVSQSRLAQQLSISEEYVRDMLQGRCSISPYVALRLEQAFGVRILSAEQLLIRQAIEDLAKARREFA